MAADDKAGNTLPGSQYKQYLTTDQYKTGSNLTARGQLHARFSTNTYGWFPWVFDQFALPESASILELGGGTGWLWMHNAARIPAGCQITVSDLSPGMLDEARKNLTNLPQLRFEIIDAESIPLLDASLDTVIANNMLYHVPDREKALGEIRRILKPGGQFYAAAIGESHLIEMEQLVGEFFGSTANWMGRRFNTFTLENGADQIRPYFPDVTLRRYPDSLSVPEAEPLVGHILSSASDELKSRRKEFAAFIADRIRQTGPIHVTKDFGMFVASRE